MVRLNISIMKEKHIAFPSYLVSIVKKFELNLDDFLLLVYFWNYKEETFNVDAVKKVLHLTENEILTSFNTLMCKKLIKIDMIKDNHGKRVEIVNLDYLYAMIDDLFKTEEKEQEKKDIYSIFETEFGRPISSMEYEIINAWTQKGFSEELILGALKEAVYNGVNNLRYIDKILYEWHRKGYKNMNEVNNHNFKSKNTETKELFDYNWLDDNEG